MDRKERIIEEIKKSKTPISATKLASICGVSRQVIVGDVALIRASGIEIIATPRGYVLNTHPSSTTYTIAVKHTTEQLADELYTIVDLGGQIIDVIVEHPIYGQLVGSLHLQSRYDIDEYLEKVKKENATDLSLLTDGLHLHTIQCPSDTIYQRILNSLENKGYLFQK